MSDKRPFSSSLKLFFVIAAAVCIWLLFAAPIFQEKERLTRNENAALVKDINEIETMAGSTEELDKKMADTEGGIKQKYASRAETADVAAARIEAICAGLGYSTSKIALGQKTLLHPAGMFVPALYSVDITFLVESTEEAGAAIIRGLENYTSADFEVTSFIYRVSVPEPKEDDEGDDDVVVDDEETYSGEWIFSVSLYYYE